MADAMAEGIKRSSPREAATAGESKGERGKASARAERPDSKTFTFVRGAHLADVMESGIKRSAAAEAEAAGATETSGLARTDKSLDRGSPPKSNDSR